MEKNPRLQTGTRIEYRRFDVLGGTRFYALGRILRSFKDDNGVYAGYHVKLDKIGSGNGAEVWGWDEQITKTDKPEVK